MQLKRGHSDASDVSRAWARCICVLTRQSLRWYLRQLELWNGQMCILACTHVGQSNTRMSVLSSCIVPFRINNYLPHESQHIGNPLQYVVCAVHRLGLLSRSSA